MKNFIISVLLIALLSAIAQQFLPWWMIAVVAFGVGAALQPRMVFLAGFIALFGLWFGYAFIIDTRNEHILSVQVAQILEALTHGSRAVLLLLSGLIGGLVGGFAALSGKLMMKLRA